MRKNQAFVLFAQCNLRKYATAQQIKKIESDLVDFERDLKEIQAKRQDAEQLVQEAQKAIHAAELDLKVLDTQEVEKKRRVLNTSNAKEYESLIKEIDLIAEKKSAREDAIFILWDNLEKAKNNREVIVGKTHNEIQYFEKEIAQKKLEHEIAAKNLEAIQGECKEDSMFVDSELLSQFNAMLESIPNPAVPIDRGSCSGCFGTVPTIDIGRAEHGDIVRCKECFRLLYVVNATL